MQKVNFTVPISNHFFGGPLKLNHKVATVDLELQAGEHIYTSSLIEIGDFFHYKVLGQIIIPYQYDSETGFLTIAGPDDTSEKQIKIYSLLEHQPSAGAIQMLNKSGLEPEARNLWSNYMNQTGELTQINKITIKQAISSLVQQLLDAGVQGVIQTGGAPIVTPNNYNQYKAMFLPAKPEVAQPTLQDISEIQAIVFSTFGGTITWPLNYTFANVIGSTHDPKPVGATSWLALWADACNNGHYTSHCSSYNYSDGTTPFPCGPDLVGGHVIASNHASKVPNGSTVFIFPICKAHNNNDNIYMSMRYNPKGVVLHHYNQKSE